MKRVKDKKAGIMGFVIVAMLCTSLVLVTSTTVSAGEQAPREPIFIGNDDSFNLANGVTSGSGTAYDPYIIEGWAIDASTADGIRIKDTTKYFVIRNCLVENGGAHTCGIHLWNVVNGKIENNTCLNSLSQYGGAIELGGSANNIISNNNCSNNNCGIRLVSSSNNTLSNNTCENNVHNGIRLHGSSNNNTLSNNTCKNNGHIELWHPCGIELYDSCDNNILDNNTCESNGGAGIGLGPSCNNNTLSNNNCGNNDYHGICLGSSSNNIISNNTCENNYHDGIHMDDSSSGNTISNTCENNGGAGIGLHESSYNNLTDNTCENNGFGILLYESSSNTIFQNYLLNNMENNAYDDGTNYWDKNGKGNYWSDWQPPDHPDADGDGIVDEPRPIAGGANQDNYPLVLVITATIDIDPDTLNLKSKGKWITCYIELPEGYDANDIDVSTILLNNAVPAEDKPTKIGDHDNDNIADLMVKFDRAAVQEILEVGDEVEVTVTGELYGGTPFEGSVTIRVIAPGSR